MTHTYPPSLVKVLQKRWAKKRPWLREQERPPLPNNQALEQLLAITYHASLLREEGRRLAFRIIAYPRDKFKDESGSPIYPVRCSTFSEPRALSVGELRRLAPAAESIRSIICVDLSSEKHWEIWGLLDTGSNWWEYIHHETSGGRPPPSYLTLSSSNPGELIASTEGVILLTLRNGSIYFPQADLLFDGLISDYLEPMRTALYRDVVKALKVKRWDPESHDNDFPKHFYNFCLSRILTCIRDKGHGGTLLLVPDQLSVADSRLTDRVAIKYPCTYDYVWGEMVRALMLHRQYYDLHFKLWETSEPITQHEYQSVYILKSQQEEVDDQLSDSFRFIGTLASVDGALVMTNRLRVLGFGAEIIALSPTLEHIKLSSDVQAKKVQIVAVEGYGTRHRSAFRFCSSFEDSVAFIVSQDGGVKAVKRNGADVFMWPDVNMGSLGL